MNCNANKCIECTVQQCAYHCDSENYCSLDKILVGTHEVNPTVDQCTDCKSFRKSKHEARRQKCRRVSCRGLDACGNCRYDNKENRL